MARHLIIGDGTAFGLTAGLVNDGAVSVQKMTQNGPTELVQGDTIADAPQIRIVGGGSAGKNIATPWIYGRDVVNYSGKGYIAPVAATATNTIAGTSAAIGELVLKIVKTSGPRVEFFTFSTTIGTAADPTIAHTAADVLIKTAFEDASLTKPDWLNPVCNATAGATVIFSGAIRGDLAYSGNTWDYEPVQIQLIVESYDGGTQTHTASATTGGSPGYGDGFAIAEMEDNLFGITYGHYLRGHLPKTPTAQAVNTNAYDMYVIAATKDGSSSSQINGVDNLIEINLALEAASANSLVVENKLNAYFASNFANVIL